MSLLGPAVMTEREGAQTSQNDFLFFRIFKMKCIANETYKNFWRNFEKNFDDRKFVRIFENENSVGMDQEEIIQELPERLKEKARLELNETDENKHEAIEQLRVSALWDWRITYYEFKKHFQRFIFETEFYVSE